MQRLELRIEDQPRIGPEGDVQFVLRASRGSQELGLFATRLRQADLMAWDPTGLDESQRYRVIAEALAERVRHHEEVDGLYAEYQQEVRFVNVPMSLVRARVVGDLGRVDAYVEGASV